GGEWRREAGYDISVGEGAAAGDVQALAAQEVLINLLGFYHLRGDGHAMPSAMVLSAASPRTAPPPSKPISRSTRELE
ncbi:hypothetical protein PMAYCL1PPCAC_20182, partial [Pristionchus mayeri]